MAFDAAVVAAHVAAIHKGRWFSLAGLPFSDDERCALARIAPHVVRVTGWSGARRIVHDARTGVGLDADKIEVVELQTRALLTVAPDVLLETMTQVLDLGIAVFVRAADTALRRTGQRDEALVRIAAEAAAQAVYRGALASAVDGTGHRFAVIESFFAAGRWPLARIDDALYVL